MLQQTRVETVIPYYKNWMSRCPDIKSLANASLQELLTIWEGLGYYQRVHNIHKTASLVKTEMAGVLPSDPHELRKLPGIGAYTAAAISSIAYGKDHPVIDGNVRRVFSRVFDLKDPIRSPRHEKRLSDIAASHLPVGKAGEYNQALMDLGATVCTPRAPKCSQCPLTELCRAYQGGYQEQRPVVVQKAAIPHLTIASAVILRNDSVLISQRPDKGLLGGLWEFPGVHHNSGEELAASLKQMVNERLGVDILVKDDLGLYKHAYTHYRVTVHAFLCCLLNGNEPAPLQATNIRWVRSSNLTGYPMGKVDRQITLRLMKDSAK